MLAIFIERRGADAVQLAPRQRGFQQIGRIHRPLALARPDQRVHLVDEQYNLPIGLLDLVEHAFQPFLELAAIFRPGDQRAHVERQQFAILQPVGHVAIGNPQRQPLGDRGLADPGFADQHRVVLGPPRQHLDRPANFFVAPDYRVQLAVPRGLREVAREALQRIVTVLRRLAVRGPPAAQLVDRGVERLGRNPRLGEGVPHPRALGEQHRQQQSLDRYELVPGLGRNLLRLVDQADRRAIHSRCGARPVAGDRRLLGD